MTNIDVARTHIAMLHNLAAGLEGIMVLASYGETPEGEKIAPRVQHFKVGDVEGMTQAAAALSTQEHRNIYMPLAVMRPDLLATAKGAEEDIIAVLGFVTDFDHGLGNEYKDRSPLTPSYVQRTSPGNAQCFFLFEKPLLIQSEQDREKAKDLVKRITQAADGADKSGADLSHVWRIPGLLNWPNKKKVDSGRDKTPCTVEIIEPFDNDFVDLSSIETLPSVEQTAKESKSTQLLHKKRIDLQELIANGDSDLAQLIEKGVPDSEDRSKAVGSVVWQLLDREYSTGDIADIIYEHRNGIGRRFNNDRNRIDNDVLRLTDKWEAQRPDSPRNESRTTFTLQKLESIDERAIPPRPIVMGYHLIRRKVTVLIAPPGVGKSVFSLSAGVSVASGDSFMGLTVHDSGPVAIINNEDDMDEMRRRLAAILRSNNISWEKLQDRLFLQSGENLRFIIAKQGNKKQALVPHHRDDLISFLKEKKIKLLIVDPFLETHEAEENDNRQINEVAGMYREIAQKADCAVLIIHHTRKAPSGSSDGHTGNMDSGRGASSLTGAARVVCTLYTMSEKDAGHYGLKEDQRHLYVRLDDAKSNLALKSDKPLWYRRESVVLANGDSVGVLKPAPYLDQMAETNKMKEDSDFILKVLTHDAFSKLRDQGKIGREGFIDAMTEAETPIRGTSCKRATLQDQTIKYLIGDGIKAGEVKIWMEKHNNRYVVYMEHGKGNSSYAGMPPLAGKKPVNIDYAAIFN